MGTHQMHDIMFMQVNQCLGHTDQNMATPANHHNAIGVQDPQEELKNYGSSAHIKHYSNRRGGGLTV